jgi:catechol 2,3-dioxygenase-like lactoylglutathione lyase family enzyme
MIPGFEVTVLGLALLATGSGEPREAVPSHDQRTSGEGVMSHVTVGVADLATALELWVETLGFEVRSRRSGPDEGLARLWDLHPQEITDQAIVETAGAGGGRLHLVEFASPGEPVRRGAANFDLCPKNLDLYTRDLPRRVAELRELGHSFKSEWVEFEVEDLVIREIHMPSHDDINVVLLELLERSYPFSAKGYAGLGALVTVVPDAEEETRFYREVLELELKSQNLLAGEEIERMIGLPSGAALDVRILGEAESSFGQIEIVEYRGVEGRDLYPRARPPARGILMAGYEVEDLEPLRQSARAANIQVKDLGRIETLTGSGSALLARSPAGLLIRFLESDSKPKP